jgi:hypothetical protein
MSLSKQEFTDAGRSMLGRAQNGERLTISKIVAGSGAATQPSDLWPLTALIAQEMNVVISAKRDYGQGTLLVEGSLRSDQAPHAFDLKEVGIMAHIGAEADRLYSVANAFADPPDHIDPAAPTIEVFKIKLIVDRIPTGDLVVQIGPSENVTGENQLTDGDGPGVYKDALGNVLRFKRLIAGPHIDLTQDANEDSITIGVKVVTRDLDFYVPLTYPGITDPAVLFPTIQDALDSVADLIIPSNRRVTVHVDAGHFPQTALVDHPNGSQIQIIGRDLNLIAVTGAVTTAVAGAAPNYTMSVIVPSLTGIAVGDVVQLFNAPDPRLELGGYVTATRPTPPTVDIRVKSQVAPPASIAAAANSKLILYPSQITANAVGTVFQIKTGIGLLKNFGMRYLPATPAGNGIVLNGATTIEKIAVVGFDYGIGVQTGAAKFNPSIMATQCNYGLQVAPYAGCVIGPPSPEGINRTVFSGNVGYGIWVVGGSFQAASNTYTYTTGNVNTGIRVDNGYWASGNATGATGGLVCGWNNVGVKASIMGVAFTALVAQNSIAQNVLWDLDAETGSQISIVHNVNRTGRYTVDGTTAVTMPLAGVGPSGGFISVLSP